MRREWESEDGGHVCAARLDVGWRPAHDRRPSPRPQYRWKPTAEPPKRVAAPVPRDQRASVASLHRRLEVLTEDNRRLRRQVSELEERLARAYGALRSVRT